MRLSKTALLCFAAVYIIWGSTYLAIRYAIETLPPWGLSAARFAVAGALMFLLAVFRREGSITREEKKVALISGPLLVIANGVVCVVEQWVPSGVAAVVIGAMPIWIMILGWMAFGQAKPTLRKMGGATIGLFGIAIIASNDFSHSTHTGAAGFGSLFLIFSSWLWASGTLVQRRVPQIKNVFRYTGYQMMAGAVVATLLAFVFEKPLETNWSAVSTTSLLALAYLIVFGSVIAFTAYSWLSRNVEPHLSSTYALVNPLIAVALGAIFYQETVGASFLAAAVLVAIGLSFLVFNKKKAVAVTTS